MSTKTTREVWGVVPQGAGVHCRVQPTWVNMADWLHDRVGKFVLGQGVGGPKGRGSWRAVLVANLGFSCSRLFISTGAGHGAPPGVTNLSDKNKCDDMEGTADPLCTSQTVRTGNGQISVDI